VPDHYDEVHGILFRPAKATAIDFKGNVVNWITLCRMEGGGIPMFRTGFAKKPFKSDKTNYVLGVCWLGSDLVQSQWFSNVPEEDFRHMQENHDDYIYILKKYGKVKTIEEAIKAEVVV
jgi:hypothetical protein